MTNAPTKRLRYAVWLIGLLAPSLTLLPLGSLWLWQQGYLLYWAIAAAVMVALTALLQRKLFPEKILPAAQSDSPGEPSWTLAENEAWKAVNAIVQRTDVDTLQSQNDILSLGAQTIDAVARQLHPEVVNPLWQFTIPEAFALSERVSRRLRAYVIDNVPLGDRLTVSQLLSAYRWRGAIDVAEKAYDVWRVIRLLNPVTAATHELREGLSRHILDKSRSHVVETLMEVYVKEVGRAAIDLYGGRLRVLGGPDDDNRRGTTKTERLHQERSDDEPIRVLLVGRKAAGTDKLIDALLGDPKGLISVAPVDAAAVFASKTKSGAPKAILVQTAEPDGSLSALKKALAEAMTCDMIIHVMSADVLDAAIDRTVFMACREQFARASNRRAPPVVIVINGPMQHSNEQALDAVASSIGGRREQVVALDLTDGASSDIAPLWQRMLDLMPEARHAKFVRSLHDQRKQWRLGSVWSQAIGAGREIGRTFRR